MLINQYGYDEHQRYDGVKKYYFAFEEAVERELKRACLIWVMEDKRKEPFAPVDILERAANGATLVYIPARGSRKFYVRRDVRAVKLGLEDRVRSMKEIQEMNHTVSEDGTINFPSIKAASQDYVDLCAAPWHPSHEMLEDDAILAKDIDSMEAICSEKVSGVQEGVQERTDRHDQEGVEERLGWSSTAGDNVLLDYDEVLAKKPEEQPSTCVSPELCMGKEVSRKRGRPRKDEEHVVLHDSNVDELCVAKRLRGERQPVQRYTPVVTTAQRKPRDSSRDPTLNEAINGLEWDKVWKPACEKELSTLAERETGEQVLAEDIPHGAPIYPTKFVLHKKEDAMGNMQEAKARLVVIGNWIQGVFQSLFAPTSHEKSLKLLFAIAIMFSLIVVGIDIKGAFLYPEMSEPVYIQLPSQITDNVSVFWRLKKTLYGLPESPSAFYNDVSGFLLRYGYTRTAADPCMFYKQKGSKLIMMVVHVDDFAVASTDQELIDDLLRTLRVRYALKVSESLETFLGIHIEHLPDGTKCLTQPKQIDELVKEYGLQKLKYANVPMSSKFSDEDQDDSPRCDYTRYMRLLGKLLFIIKTRPDIAYAVNRLATRAQWCTEKDFQALLRVVSYLGGTREMGICFHRTAKADAAAATRLFCFVDATYASHPDSRSQTGYCFSLGDFAGMFYSRSTKQTNVTLSSTESENSAAVEATKEIIWFRQLLAELGFEQLEPTLIFADNASMITLAEDFSGNHKRVKHYITRVNFLIEQVREGVIRFQHVPSESNVADILTKPLGPVDFHRLRPLLLGMKE